MIALKRDEPGFASAIRTGSTGAIAGLAGGGAEIGWIAIYQHLSGGEAAAVARGVTVPLFPTLGTATVAVPLGIAIHMGLATLLGVAIAVLVRSQLPRSAPMVLEPLAVVGLLVGVWATNFFLVLPAINPAFVALTPDTTGLISKVLFGAAAALVLRLLDEPHPAAAWNWKGDR